MSEQPPVRESVAVIGAGAAGLGAAWLLARGGYTVHLYEAEPTAGGHAHTIDIPIPGNASGAIVPVDAGFIVYNTRTYPDLVSLFEHLGVEEENSCMSFAASVHLPSRSTPFEWGSDSIATLFADRENLYRPSIYRMLYDMRRFNNAVYSFVENLESDPEFKDRDISLGEFLRVGSYSAIFTRAYLIPMVSAVWSATIAAAMAFPARSLFHFFINHGLAQVFARPQWRTPAARSRDYVAKVLADIRIHSGVILLNTPVTKVARTEERVTIYARDCEPKNVDHVVFATHAPTALHLLGPDATEDERSILGAFQYTENAAYIHYDESLMPGNKTVWASWNFMGRPLAESSSSTGESPSEHDQHPVCVSYWLNKLQNYHKFHLPVPDLFLTLNPSSPIDPGKVLKQLSFSHPQFTVEAVKAQSRLQDILQGRNRSWFCGAYCRYGFHEDAMMTGLDVAEKLSGEKVLRPWKSKHRLDINNNARHYELPYSPLRTPFIIYLGALLILNAVTARLQQGLGKIAARMADEDPVVVIASGNGRLYRFGPRRTRMRIRSLLSRSSDSLGIGDTPSNQISSETQSARLTVRSPKLLARIAEALRQGQELAPIAAASFAASEYDCPTPDDLTVVLKTLFIADGLDLDPSQARKGRAKLAESLLYSIVGRLKKIEALPTHTRLPELTTCVSSVVYPSWWLEVDRPASDVDGESVNEQTLSSVSPGNLRSSTNVIEILGDLSETTISLLQSSKDCRATIVVRTEERIVFMERKAELLFVLEQIQIIKFEDFLKRYRVLDGTSDVLGREETRFDLIISPALLNLHKGLGFRSLHEALSFVRTLGTPDAVLEFGATVLGVRARKGARRNPGNSRSLFSGDQGFSLYSTGDLIEAAEKNGFELQRMSFLNAEEAGMDVFEVIQRVYNSLAREKLEADETRIVLAQMCLWEAALRVNYIRRLAASLTMVAMPA